jgi:hypothetical protein
LDPSSFAILLSGLLDGLAIQIALEDPVVGPERAFDLSMRFISDQLGFEWSGRRRKAHGRSRPGGPVDQPREPPEKGR